MAGEPLADRVEAALADLPSGMLHVAFSGGLDSSVLLDLLAASPAARARGLHALHVDHGLHADSAHWAAHCRRVAAGYAVPIAVEAVAVERRSGLGLEAAARAARHAAFARRLATGGIVALGQHRDDQAETVLLKLLRGAGPEALGAMRARRRHGGGWLWRPLLELPRRELLAHARRRGLDWIEDPSNATAAHDRNFLRLEILPRLRARWPAADANLAQAATRAQEASGVVDAAARRALEELRGGDPASLPVAGWLALAPAVRDAVLRLWLRERGLQAPTREQAAELARQLSDAADDRVPRIAWQATELRRYRGRMHAFDRRASPPREWERAFDGRPLVLPAGLGHLALLDADGTPVRVSPPLRVRFRCGGERLRLAGRAHHSELRDLFQQAGVPPWQRGRVPILAREDGEVIAVAGHFVGAEAEALFERARCRLEWRSDAH